ncbi:MAG: alpha-L-arabinofuranosidase [Williamsia sp.]|nr:alpha-L-arabinofuranosidase [Williamsia sp.]
MQRRNFLKLSGLSTASLAITSTTGASVKKSSINTLDIDPDPLFELSPFLYMQFMEPLGVTDSSVEAAWDHTTNDWKPTVINTTKELSPGMMRWGGNMSAYYKWREGVGPRAKRVPFYNTDWGGMETSQIGTAEFVDFAKRVGNAEPLVCVNFESDGLPRYATNGMGQDRRGFAKEAAEWVDYCNNPSNKERIAHGFKDPLTIKHWQLGNETSYRPGKGFDNLTAAKKTVEFAKAMHAVDPSLKFIGWGDSGWTKILMDEAGKHIDYIAFHHMFDPGEGVSNSPVRNNEYRKDPAATWDVLMNAYKIHEKKINKMRDEAAPYKMPLALTECHYSIEGRNRCEVMSSWATGVSYGRVANLHERNGDVLKIGTMADFCGTRWQVNALMIPVPNGEAYLMPSAKIMQLYRHHTGKNFIKTSGAPSDLDITASRTGNTIYLHVVNTNRTDSVDLSLRGNNLSFTSGKAFEIAADPTYEIMSAAGDILKPKERTVNANEPFRFAPASVTAVELNIG